MKAISFDPDIHLKTITDWCRGWKMAEFQAWFLPDSGFMVENVIAAFLYKTNSGVAYMENIISNPETDKETRFAALSQLTETIIGEARACGYRVLLGLSDNESVIEHAKALGFKQDPHARYSLIRKL